jgi:hypothetical protein
VEEDLTGITDRHGRWVLPLGDGEVTQLVIDYSFTLVIDSWINIRISCPFSVTRQNQERTYDPETPTDLGSLLDLHKAVVTSAEVVKDGHLRLEFANGDSLSVAPDEHYEAFTVNGQLPPIKRRFTLVSLPGGGLTRM